MRSRYVLTSYHRVQKWQILLWNTGNRLKEKKKKKKKKKEKKKKKKKTISKL